MAGGRDTDFRFLATPEELTAVLEEPALAPLRAAVAQAETSTFFDTPERSLERAGLVLRLRQGADGRIFQSLEASRPGLPRADGESPESVLAEPIELARHEPDLSHLAQSQLGEVDLARLAPIFTLRLKRRVALITFTVARIEVTLDEGEIIAADKRLPVLEMSFEMKSGRRRGLHAFVRKMSRRTPLQISLIGAAERGLRLVAGSWGQPVKMAAPQLDPDMEARDGFAAIARNCLRQVMLNAPAFEGSEVVEAIHQTRVAVRRLRAAMSLFRPLLADERGPRIARDLKWISDLLGHARDIDVLLTERIQPAVESGERIPGLGDLTEIITQKQALTHADLLAGLKSVRHRRLITELLLWIEDGDWREPHAASAGPEAEGEGAADAAGEAAPDLVHPEEKLKLFLARRLRAARRKLARLGAHMESLPEEELHQLRIRAKKLRYQAAFFTSLAQGPKTGKRYGRLVVALEEVQEVLGHMHDSEATAALLEAEASAATRKGSQRDPLILFAAGRLAGAHPNRTRLVQRAAEALRDAIEVKPFWKGL
jgi:inorganic triphosphatase YgiF